jgi:hypothetical protein
MQVGPSAKKTLWIRKENMTLGLLNEEESLSSIWTFSVRSAAIGAVMSMVVVAEVPRFVQSGI